MTSGSDRPDSRETPRAPVRVQLRRTKGWRMLTGAVLVTRPGKYGNPFRGPTAAADFRRYLARRQDPPPGWVDLLGYPSDDEIRSDLCGQDLACWCSEDADCHADVLLEVANR